MTRHKGEGGSSNGGSWFSWFSWFAWPCPLFPSRPAVILSSGPFLSRREPRAGPYSLARARTRLSCMRGAILPMGPRWLLVVLVALLLDPSARVSCAAQGAGASQPDSGSANSTSQAQAGDLWVVLVGTSRNWLNYRDNSNTIAHYRTLRRLGVPDSHIILMLGHSMACDPRNPHPGELFVNPDHAWDLYSQPIEVDYRGAEVTVESFLRVLSGFHFPGTPASKKLQSGPNSRILIYLTGHGGDKFLKFQDKEELQANDLADALHQMYLQKRYASVLLMTDTCQADTMHSQLHSPGIVAIASSAKGENSYSYLPDTDLGVSVVDRFTFTTLRFVEDALAAPNPEAWSLQKLFDAFDPTFLMATPCLRSDLFPLPLAQVPALDYFVWSPSSSPSSSAGSANSTSSQGNKETHEAAPEDSLPWPWALHLGSLLSLPSASWGHLQWLWDALAAFVLSSPTSSTEGEGQADWGPDGGRGEGEGNAESERERWVAATVGVWMAVLLLVSSLSLGRRNHLRSATQ